MGKKSCDNEPVVSDYNGYGYVDLGLSVKWATCNVGADSPEDYGDYFAWGETKPKLSYTEENYTYTDSPETLSSIRDAASVNMGGSWRMPTLKELIDKCTWTWTTLNGVEGYEVKSKKIVMLSSFLLLAIVSIVVCTSQGRTATIGRVRSIRAARPTPSTSTSIRAT